ncbi:hypothetical protein ISS05_02015 [Candidatus Woesearchaeota archaeon]|nr:hypothetical protein [Candidatus Woesearchaeota archaeon]
MVKVDSVPDAYIQYKGVWDWDDLYNTIADFFRNQKFKFNEVFYKHKPTPFGGEKQIGYIATKKVEDYYQYKVDMFIHTYDTREVEVKMKDGSKKIFTKGRIWIQIMGDVNADYEGKWEDNTFYVRLREFYHKYVVFKKIGAIWWDEMHYKVTGKLRNVIMQRLKMEAEQYEHRYFAGVH